MSKPSPILGRDLGLAICKHFGIDTTKHTVDSDFEIKTEPGKPVTVKLTLMLTADDLAGIARAAGADDGEQGPELVNFSTPSRVYTADETRDILRRYAAGTKAATQALTIKVDASEAAEILRRYGARVERSEIAALTEEVRQLRKELNKSLYEVAKNTKRSADIADSSFAVPAMVTQTKATPVGGGPSASCSGQEGPRSGDFFDKHGIKNVYLGGQG